MKRNFILLCAALLLSLPLHAQQNEDWKNAQQTWQIVQQLTAELDKHIEKRQLAQVHDAALNLRDSVRDLRLAWQNLDSQKRNEANALIKRIDGLIEALHEHADHNEPREVVKNQRALHVLLDEIGRTFPDGILGPVGPLTARGDVKDPFCRMTVDVATAPAKAVHNGQTYYFCAPQEAQEFKKNPAPYVALYDDLRFGKPKVFTVGLHSEDIKANVPAKLAFAIREQGKSQLVQKYQLVHEKFFHLIIVSDDLSWFAHEHPQLAPDNRFYLKQTFPRAGRYFLYSDFTPGDGSNQVVRNELNVGGAQEAAHKSPPLAPDKELSKTIDGYKIGVQVSPSLQAGKQSVLTYSIAKNGAPITDLESYLAASGHMMAIHQNGRDIVHTHAVSAGADPHTGLEVTPEMATAKGPNVSFKLQLPSGGLYRIWAQFQHQGKVLTAPFTFAVKGNTNGSPGEKMKTKTMTAFAVGAAMTAVHAAPKAKTSPTKTAPQKVTITLPEGYKNNTVAVKAGQPVALTFHLKSDAGCGNIIKVPAAKWEKTLKVGEKATVLYTPAKSGKLAFACGMDHMKGSLIVK